ncbi:hypothetical protein EMCG_07349 [[Emmonsia] crescens]|uniref:C2H2-type domain-containing protein n=1 Tax=[Emmonsia] crescens TaxID=73230 RepID=A0A0G2I8M4_9EURO|nr:hypothetical protein EMCG_07349 [Emmonsia crescens UAMH 3008]
MAGDAPYSLATLPTSDSTVSIQTPTEYVIHIESQNPAETAKSENNLIYGCAFGKCTEIFRSKDEWKRHENENHFQLEAWRCSVRNAENHECARLFYNRSGYAEHLRDEHNFEETIRKTLDENTIGRNGQYQYWCGFCRVLLRLQTKGSDAWDERYDHIGDHIENQWNYYDWLLEEGHRTKGDIAADGILERTVHMYPDEDSANLVALVSEFARRVLDSQDSPADIRIICRHDATTPRRSR